MDSQGTCSNCNKQFDSSKLQLHEAYCLRNFRKCPQCEEFIDKRELQAHNEEKHLRQPCKYACGSQLLVSEVEAHLKSCPRKPRFCSFCGLEIDPSEFDEHISVCGARTKECAICGKSIILFDFEFHQEHCVGTKDNLFPRLEESSFQKEEEAYQAEQEEKARRRREEQLLQQKREDQEIKLKKLYESEKRETEFAAKVKEAVEKGDDELMKKLQMEQDEFLAQEFQKQFSPKNKPKNNSGTELKKQESENPFDYNYDYDQHEDDDAYNNYEDDNDQYKRDQEEVEKINQVYAKNNNPPPQIAKSASVQMQEDMGQYCDDPELQEAILRSNQM